MIISYFIRFIIITIFFASSNVFAFEVEKTSSGKDIKWYNPNVIYLVNTSGGPSGSLAAIEAAMKTWSDTPTTSFEFIYGGESSSTAHGVDDNNNLISFGSSGETGVVARNYFWYDVSSGFLFDSDIQFNTDYLWSTDNKPDTFDIQNIATHEFGHSLALKDLYNADDSEKTMYYSGFIGETKKRTLEQDDINGITYLYPSNYCTFAIYPSNQTFNAGGGTGSISITASSSACNWTSVSNDLWVIVTSGIEGAGNGTVQYSISANTVSSSRVGTITIAGETFTIAQSGVQQNILSINKMGGGKGKVTSSPQGINCGDKCYESFNANSFVTLTATADPDSSFVGWISSECSGTSDCTAKLDQDKNVVAIFELQQKNQYTLDLTKGWNFVSIQQPLDISIGAVLKDIVSGGVKMPQSWRFENVLSKT